MATEERFYLYRHVRLDTNEPFYIGIGTKPLYFKKYEIEFGRAFCFKQRNEYWHRVFKKVEGNIIVEILMESENRDFICEKEKEFITFYKLSREGGTLTNLSLGGEYSSEGYKHTEEAKIKMVNNRKSNKGMKYKISNDMRKYKSEINKTPTVIDNGRDKIEFSSVKEAREYLGISVRHCSRLIRTGKSNSEGFTIYYKK